MAGPKTAPGEYEPIEDQISELHRTRTFGNLALIYRTSSERGTPGLWSIRTHGGNDQERLTWMEAVIAAEGRSPWQEGSSTIRPLSSLLSVDSQSSETANFRRRPVAI